MTRPLNECIASRAFASLILDYEEPADEILPAYCSCRILIEDLFQEKVITETREEAIEYFNNWRS